MKYSKILTKKLWSLPSEGFFSSTTSTLDVVSGSCPASVPESELPPDPSSDFSSSNDTFSTGFPLKRYQDKQNEKKTDGTLKKKKIQFTIILSQKMNCSRS